MDISLSVTIEELSHSPPSNGGTWNSNTNREMENESDTHDLGCQKDESSEKEADLILEQSWLTSKKSATPNTATKKKHIDEDSDIEEEVDESTETLTKIKREILTKA